MEKKYELVKNTELCVNNHFLYRVRALKDFDTVKKGDICGYIEKEENLSHEGNCWIYDNAKIYGNAKVLDNARVLEFAVVYDNAKIYENATIFGYAEVFGDACAFGECEIHDNAKVYGKSNISGMASIYNNAKVYGFSEITRNANICKNADISGFSVINGSCSVYGCIDGVSCISSNALICENAHITDTCISNECISHNVHITTNDDLLFVKLSINDFTIMCTFYVVDGVVKGANMHDGGFESLHDLHKMVSTLSSNLSDEIKALNEKKIESLDDMVYSYFGL